MFSNAEDINGKPPASGASFTMQPDSSKGEFPAVSNPAKFYFSTVSD
jgi:hypothetical protein